MRDMDGQDGSLGEGGATAPGARGANLGDETVPANLERGRWTLQLPDESPSEAMDRLMRGEPGGEVNMSPRTRKMLDDAFSKPSEPYFTATGKPRGECRASSEVSNPSSPIEER